MPFVWSIIDKDLAFGKKILLILQVTWNHGTPNVCQETLLKLVPWLAPSLRTAGAGNGDVEMRDRGTIMWEPVSIWRDLVEFQFRDPTAGPAHGHMATL